MSFFEELRATPEFHLITCGDARRMLQHDHRTNLLYWLMDQFQAGLSVDQICILLAL
jgi:hypothetical protein